MQSTSHFTQPYTLNSLGSMDLTCTETRFYNTLDGDSLESYIDTCGHLGTIERTVDYDVTNLDRLHPETRCVGCMSAKSEVVFLPCRHLVCCKSCSELLVNTSCPMCRSRVAVKLSSSKSK
ncbi:iap-like protein [Heliothis virescens ascovirus 3g]|uniref:Iap-like protein n=1 Tax=Heliothis virescens ascovirus 3g TaxID=1246651 RepID=K4NXY3_9VIRU|nr:iap-like protein [Heliothis virescens ascovirus 3g]AFV50275.1 iap-like protein [Heliothis virescens ascovirus 3g]